MSVSASAGMPRRAPARSRVIGVSLVVLVLALAGLAQTGPGTSIARSLGLASSSERFTELYFNHQATIAAGTEGTLARVTHQSVSFQLANHESATTTYRWQISSDGTVRTSGSTRLAANAQRTVSATVPTGCRFSTVHGATHSTGPARTQITVKLSAPQNSISYWLQCHA